MKGMKGWNFENEQWTRLPYNLKHLPLFTRHFDLMSAFFRILWGLFLKGIVFQFLFRLKVIGDFKKIHKEHPKLLVISNHSSHLDAISITAAIPFRYWMHLYIAAAKDYFFTNFWFTFFSKHCLGAIPIDRKAKRGGAIALCLNLLKNLSEIWLVMFPEGTRSQDGYIHHFKKGISVFAERTNTPVLFLYLDGARRLWPKGQRIFRPGKLTLYIGPVQPPAPVEIIDQNYRNWVKTIFPEVIKDEPAPTSIAPQEITSVIN